jgi:hypothetical protein
MNAYELATMAGCLQPDDEDTYGAHWLDEIQWRAQYGTDGEYTIDTLARFMATSPPVWRVWKLYAELGGWQFVAYAQRVATSEDLTDIARRALYSIASKLVRELSATTEVVA